MEHPDFERIRAFADGSLPREDRTAVAAHLEGCARCRAVLASIPRLVAAVEEETDLEVPAGAWERILERRAAGERIIPPALIHAPVPVAEERDDTDDTSTPNPLPPQPIVTGSAVPSFRTARREQQRGGWTPAARRAAVLVLGVAGVASASLGVPLLREWLRGYDAARATVPTSSPRSAETPSAVVEPAPVSGVSIPADGGSVTVDVDAPDPGLRIRVRLVDAAELEARATGAASGAVYHPRRGRLRVQNAGAGELELLLPRSVPRITVRVDGEPYLVKEGGQIHVLGPAAGDSAGSEVVLRVPGAH
jgi:anti-sigma factor RsiW